MREIAKILHLAVYKDSSTTTKVRVVFDASIKTTSGYWLNDILYTGSVIQPEMLSYVINIHIAKFIFTTDIAKMYL